MKDLRHYLRVAGKNFKVLFGWQVSLDDVSLRDAKGILPKCRRVDITGTDKFRVQQLRKAASEAGYAIMRNGDVKKMQTNEWAVPRLLNPKHAPYGVRVGVGRQVGRAKVVSEGPLMAHIIEPQGTQDTQDTQDETGKAVPDEQTDTNRPT